MNGTVVAVSELGKKDSVDRMADVALNAIDKLEKENAYLRGKLETTENRLGISPCGDDKIDELEQAFSFMKFERDELSAKIGQFEQYAELGRLILNGNPCYFGYEYADGDCVSVVCSDNEKKVCKKRAELMGNNHD